MEVVVPVQDLHFDSTASSPYVSAPSSPRSSAANPFNYYCHYTSAPTTPTRAAALLAGSSSVPFTWEEKPGTPKSPKAAAATTNDDEDDGYDFAFDFSGQLDKGGLPPEPAAADELFDKGKIRPLKPPPRLYHPARGDHSSPRSPKSPKSSPKLWSPRHRGRVGSEEAGIDPFAAAMAEATRDTRGRVPPSAPPGSRSRKGSRSLSPMREGGGGAVAGFFFHRKNPSCSSPSAASTAAAAAAAPAAAAADGKSGGGSRKWRLRDLLLFRSASEGRATGNRSKDPLRKYTATPPPSASSGPLLGDGGSTRRGRRGEDSRNSSFRSTDSGGSVRRGSGQLSAHEIHYVSNRAASEELKKKTPLAYRQGLFGCLRFNPAVNSIARGFGGYQSSNRGRP